MTPEEKLKELNISLPKAPKPMGVYKPIVLVGTMAYLSGHGPLRDDGTLIVGRVGEDMDLQDGYDAARQTGLALLATLRTALGTLDRVRRVIKTLGLVNSADDFVDQPKVINGCSELFAEIFGIEHGVGARSALAANTLPGGIAVEIEMIVEITPE